MTTRLSSFVLLRRGCIPRPRHGVVPSSWRVRTSSTSTSTSAASVGQGSASATASTTSTSSTTNTPPIAWLVGAAGAGIVTVSAAAGLVESATSTRVPAYHPTQSRYDATTFAGRFCHMLLACDPRLLLYTSTQVQQAQQLLSTWAEYQDDRSMDRPLWEAHRLVHAAIHPDTQQVIPRPFRMSGYVPFNGPICVAMVASTSTPALLFWSWVNQSQNALVNYYNRNASSPMSNQTLALSYAGAVTSALTVAFGLATLLQRKYPPKQAQQLLKWVAFPSAVVASSLNCFIVRSPEMEMGVPLLDPETYEPIVVEDDNDNRIAISQEAARRGVYATTASRAVLQAPVYFLPPLLLSTLGGSLVAKHPRLATPLTTYLLLVCFGLGLPASVACFPQMATIPVQDLEEQYATAAHMLWNAKTGRPYEVVAYNKGL